MELRKILSNHLAQHFKVGEIVEYTGYWLDVGTRKIVDIIKSDGVSFAKVEGFPEFRFYFQRFKKLG